MGVHDAPSGTVLVVGARGNERWQPRACWLYAIGREFLSAFAFPDGKPVFTEPWDQIQS